MRETENAHPFSRSASRAHCCSGTATIERMEKDRSIAFHLANITERLPNLFDGCIDLVLACEARHDLIP